VRFFRIFYGCAPISSTEITRWLKAWGAGDQAALDRLVSAVYDELRRIARRHMRKERPGVTLQTTALVNEAYLRLVDAGDVNWQDRTHFFAICAQMMRRTLVDAARARAAAKRGGQGQRAEHSTAFDLDQVQDVSSSRDRELVVLDDALADLAKMDPRKARVIELRFFGGLSVEEAAEVLKISPQSVMRDWNLAKAWLTRELSRAGLGSGMAAVDE
jgi:RNA polymerase sigma factor (TIGR02999 family)